MIKINSFFIIWKVNNHFFSKTQLVFNCSTDCRIPYCLTLCAIWKV
eukprot:UN32207